MEAQLRRRQIWSGWIVEGPRQYLSLVFTGDEEPHLVGAQDLLESDGDPPRGQSGGTVLRGMLRRRRVEANDPSLTVSP